MGLCPFYIKYLLEVCSTSPCTHRGEIVSMYGIRQNIHMSKICLTEWFMYSNRIVDVVFCHIPDTSTQFHTHLYVYVLYCKLPTNIFQRPRCLSWNLVDSPGTNLKGRHMATISSISCQLLISIPFGRSFTFRIHFFPIHLISHRKEDKTSKFQIIGGFWRFAVPVLKLP